MTNDLEQIVKRKIMLKEPVNLLERGDYFAVWGQSSEWVFNLK